jgi:hypothetical protein
MHTYQLRVAIVGVSRDADATMKIITIPIGAVLTIATIRLESGLVDAAWHDQTVSVFVQDLKTRGRSDSDRSDVEVECSVRTFGPDRFTDPFCLDGPWTSSPNGSRTSLRETVLSSSHSNPRVAVRKVGTSLPTEKKE